MTEQNGNDGPTLGERVAPVLRAIGIGLARGAGAVRRGVIAFDAPAKFARTRAEIRALGLDRHAAVLAKRGGAGARAAAGRARVEAERAAAVGGPALRRAWNRSAAKLAALGHRPPRLPRGIDSPRAGNVADLLQGMPPAPAADVPPAASVQPSVPPLPQAPSVSGWLNDRKTQFMIAFGGLAIGALAVALATAQPAGGPAPGSDAFGNAVRAYILDHPEIIPEAVAKLQARETGKTIADNRDALQTPFSGAWAGAAGGNVVLVEFTDYACGFCRASVADVDRLIAEDTKLKVVFREIPILGPASDDAALVALSAARQGRYMPLHRGLFAAGAPDAEKIIAVAKADGLDPAKIARDRTDPTVRAELDKNLALARTIGLSGTPTFIVGDKILSGAVGYDALKAAIAEARAPKTAG